MKDFDAVSANDAGMMRGTPASPRELRKVSADSEIANFSLLLFKSGIHPMRDAEKLR